MCKHGLMLLANRLEVFEPVTVKLGRAREADASVCQQYHAVSAVSSEVLPEAADTACFHTGRHCSARGRCCRL